VTDRAARDDHRAIVERFLDELARHVRPTEAKIDEFLTEHGFGGLAFEYHELYDESGSFPAWGEVLYPRR